MGSQAFPFQPTQHFLAKKIYVIHTGMFSCRLLFLAAPRPDVHRLRFYPEEWMDFLERHGYCLVHFFFIFFMSKCDQNSIFFPPPLIL